MNQTQFDQTTKNLQDVCERIVASKRPAYTSQDADVLINFKEAGRDAGTSALQAWFVLFNKHYSAIKSFVKDPDCPQAEDLVGRFADMRNYLDLGFALYEEMLPRVDRTQGCSAADMKQPAPASTPFEQFCSIAQPAIEWLRTYLQ